MLNKKYIIIVGLLVFCVSCKNSINKDNVKIIAEGINESGGWQVFFEIKDYDKKVVYASTEWQANGKVHIELSKSRTNDAPTPVTMKGNRFVFTLPWHQAKKEISMDFNGHGLGSWTRES